MHHDTITATSMKFVMDYQTERIGFILENNSQTLTALVSQTLKVQGLKV